MPTLTASPKLLISQWAGGPTLTALLEIWLAVLDEQVFEAARRLRLMQLLDTAEGVWLDYMGQRLGVARPGVTATGLPAFGFDEAGHGFDQAQFHDPETVQPKAALGDVVYRRLLRARVWTILGYGNANYLRRAALEIDESARLIEETAGGAPLQMQAVLQTTREADMQLANQVGALPRPGGVALQIGAPEFFGFDQAGVSFDQGRMKTGRTGG